MSAKVNSTDPRSTLDDVIKAELSVKQLEQCLLTKAHLMLNDSILMSSQGERKSCCSVNWVKAKSS